jgi:hypothetical protein
MISLELGESRSAQTVVWAVMVVVAGALGAGLMM